MSATKEQLTEELKSLMEQRDGLIAQLNQIGAQVNQVQGAVQAIKDVLDRHYADEPKIVVPTHEQRQSVEQKKALRFPVPTVQG